MVIGNTEEWSDDRVLKRDKKVWSMTTLILSIMIVLLGAIMLDKTSMLATSVVVLFLGFSVMLCSLIELCCLFHKI